MLEKELVRLRRGVNELIDELTTYRRLVHEVYKRSVVNVKTIEELEKKIKKLEDKLKEYGTT